MSSAGDVVRGLRAIIDAADEVAVQATRARADVDTARTSLVGAGRGNDHPAMRDAVAHAGTASDKLGKMARLLAEAANAFNDYLIVVAPGGGTRTASPSSVPSGTSLVEESTTRSTTFGRFVRRTVEKADDVAETAKSIAETIKRPPGGTAFTQQVPQSAPPTPAVAVAVTPSHGDLASGLIIVGVIGAAVGHRVREMLRKITEQDDEDNGRNESRD